MKILQTISSYATQQGLSFLVIGGHAVIAHGFGRSTADLDLMVPERQRTAWKALISQLGFTLYHEQGPFAQFQPKALAQWPVDLAFVSDATFDQLMKESTEMEHSEGKARIPSIRHLLAMKIQALKTTHEGRELKDLGDVVELMRLAGLSADGVELRQLCERYATMEVYDKVRLFKRS